MRHPFEGASFCCIICVLTARNIGNIFGIWYNDKELCIMLAIHNVSNTYLNNSNIKYRGIYG